MRNYVPFLINPFTREISFVENSLDQRLIGVLFCEREDIKVLFSTTESSTYFEEHLDLLEANDYDALDTSTCIVFVEKNFNGEDCFTIEWGLSAKSIRRELCEGKRVIFAVEFPVVLRFATENSQFRQVTSSMLETFDY